MIFLLQKNWNLTNGMLKSTFCVLSFPPSFKEKTNFKFKTRRLFLGLNPKITFYNYEFHTLLGRNSQFTTNVFIPYQPFEVQVEL
jgi:hypothetical protein